MKQKRCYKSSAHCYESESLTEGGKVVSCRDGHELFRIAKQRVWEKSDVVGVSCLEDESGVVKVSVDDRKKRTGLL